MPIFNREKTPPAATPTPRPRPMERQTGEKRENPTYIAAGSRITGEIRGTAEVLVDGEFEGHLHLDSTVVIGREGRVQGEIRARAVRIEGRVVGDVRGIERVEVMASGTLEGDISASRVVIAEGAFFKGNVEMTGKESQGVPRPSRDAEAMRDAGPSQNPVSRDRQQANLPKVKNKHRQQGPQPKSPQQQALEAESAPGAGA